MATKEKMGRVARVDGSKNYGNNLPSDILNDLQEAFNFYDKEETGLITTNHFVNILQNFGYHKLSLKERQDDLRKNDPDFPKNTTHVPFDFVKHIVGYRWSKTGKDDEANECFRLFDRRDRNMINFTDIKNELVKHLEFPITDDDVKDFMNECDPSGSGHVTGRAFKQLYNS